MNIAKHIKRLSLKVNRDCFEVPFELFSSHKNVACNFFHSGGYLQAPMDEYIYCIKLCRTRPSVNSKIVAMLRFLANEIQEVGSLRGKMRA